MKPHDIGRAIVAVGMTVAGLTGIYFKIEYAGWVLFVGMVVALDFA